MNPNLVKLRKLEFRKGVVSALDALAIFVPKNAPPDPELDELLKRAVQSRWYPVENGEDGLILYRGGPYNADRFQLRKGAWDHAHCAACRRHLAIHVPAWISVDSSATILCEDCHDEMTL